MDRQPVLFFDGVCGLCNKFIDFLLRRKNIKRLRFSPLQGETAKQALPYSLRESLSTVVLFDGENIYVKSAAVLKIFRVLGGGWAILAFLAYIVPRFIRDYFYEKIAENRYRVFGKKDTCRIPTKDERKLFLP